MPTHNNNIQVRRQWFQALRNEKLIDDGVNNLYEEPEQTFIIAFDKKE